MASKDHNILESHVVLDDILQPNGINLPMLTNLSELDFEFFSDEEDNTCIVVDAIVPTVAELKVNNSKAFTRSDSKEYDLPQNPKELQELTVSLPSISNLVQPSQSIMIQTDSKTVQSIDTQTAVKETHHHETNTITVHLSHSEVQTDPVIIQEIREEQEMEKSIKAVPSSPSSPLPIAASEKTNPTSMVAARTEYKSAINSNSNSKMYDEDEIKSTIAQPDLSTTKPSPVHPSPTRQHSKFDFVMDPMNMKISFLDFAVGDIALFVPVDDKKEHWMAFHSNRPHRYLAKESLDVFLAKDKQRGGRDRSRILGRIILIDSHVASVDENPYHLPLGSSYHICYLEPLLVPKKKATQHPSP